MGKAAISRIHDVDVLLDILDALPTSIFVKNEALQFELSNAAHCDIVGLPADKLLGFSDADFYPPEEAKGFLAGDRKVLDSGETVETEEHATNQSGVTVPCLTRKSKLVTATGKTYLIGTNTNLTELRKREAQHRALAETVPVGIWQVDETGRTTFANPLLLAYLGTDAEGLPGMDIGGFIGAGHAAFPGEAGRFETDLVPVASPPRRVLVISSGWLSLAAGEARSAIVSVVDISEMTELKRVNDEISRLNRELAGNMRKLKEAQDEIMRKGRMAQLGQLIATVAHEIRNPLGAVRTAAFLIERKIKDKGLGIEPQLQRIGNGITRCDDIITQLLDFSRSRALQCEPVAVDEWLAKIIEEEATSLPAVIAIECNLELGGTTASIDTGRMNRAIINLVSNAAEAMVGKGDDPSKFATEHPKITVSTARHARGVEISVRDNGPGISGENLQKIMEPLFTTKNFGTGLGLPAVEKILQEHGGGLSIASKPGEGATFTVWFPVNRGDEQSAA